jgi:hypothetical protein
MHNARRCIGAWALFHPPFGRLAVRGDLEEPGRFFLGDECAAEIQAAVPRLGLEQRPVVLLFAGAEEMHHLVSARVQEFGDQAPVATPPKRLRAHEAGIRFYQRCGEGGLPALRAHPGGVAAKGGDAQAIEHVFTWLTGKAAAQLDRVPICDAAFLERRPKRRLIELWIVTRSGESSHIDDGVDAGLTDNRYEFFRTSGPMPDRPDDHCAPGEVSLLPAKPRR